MSKRIETERLYLRSLTVDDASDRYVFWLNDPETSEYLVDAGRNKHTIDSVKSFIEHINKKDDEILFGIFLKESDQHIGNIKIGPIKPYHLIADLGFLIGEKSEWGKGYGSEAIKAVINYSFDKLKLNKLSAGLYACNIGCAQALEKSGFVKEGHRIKHYLFKGEPEDILEYGVLPK